MAAIVVVSSGAACAIRNAGCTVGARTSPMAMFGGGDSLAAVTAANAPRSRLAGALSSLSPSAGAMAAAAAEPTAAADPTTAAARRGRRGSRCMALNDFRSGTNMHDEFDENDEEYVAASVLQATEVHSSADGFMVNMSDGSMLRCAHNKVSGVGARLPEYSPQPAVVLKLEDGSDVLLPLIVMEHSSTMLMEAVRKIPLMRPTVFMVIRDMVELMGYEVKVVRVTHRVSDAYYARAYLSKVGDEFGPVLSFDLRPSDAINLAIRAKAPIQVNRDLAMGDGVRQLGVIMKQSSSSATTRRASRGVRRRYGFVMTDADMADEDDLAVSSEFTLIQLMERAVQEQRFADAARIRDKLKSFRESPPQRKPKFQA